jgi:hypothetical protein
MKCLWVEITKFNEDKVTIELNLEMKKHKYKVRKFKFEMDYGCIPTVQFKLRKLWEPERDRRQANLDRISKSLGASQ